MGFFYKTWTQMIIDNTKPNMKLEGWGLVGDG